MAEEVSTTATTGNEEDLKKPETQAEPEQPKKHRPKCPLCDKSFSCKQTLDHHYDNGICLGRGYMCLRCFAMKKTPSELHRHQMSERKCKPSQKATVRKDENGNIVVIIKK